MSETCALCLGGDSEVPPFGTLKDAQDLLQPCSTCQLVTHRKCLIDYINSISFSKIEREISGPDPNAHSSPYTISVDSDNDTDNEPSILGFTVRARWVSLLGAGVAETRTNGASANPHNSWKLSTPCPQCKSKIEFKLKGSAVLGFNALVRDKIVDMASYSIIALGLLGASAGIISVGVTGLTVCGLNMVRAVSPGFLDSLRPSPVGGSARANSSAASASNQVNLHQISLLPVIMYRMRGSSLMDCLFKRRRGPVWPEIFNELLICNFLSALGNHVLVKSLWRNAKAVFSHSNGISLIDLLKSRRLLQNINWTSPSVLVALVVPFRWAYDILYRETFNRMHFSMARAVRPKDLADSLSPKDYARLETLESRISGLSLLLGAKIDHAKKSWSLNSILILFKEKHLYAYLHCKVLHMFYKSKACLVHDYSDTLLVKSGVVTFVTTVMWPFMASYLGKAVCVGLRSVPYFSSVSDLPFLSNLLAMGILAVAKDASNLFLCYQKCRQLSDLTIIKTEKEPQKTSFPGAFT